MIKVGDLVRIKHTNVVALVTRIVLARSFYKSISKPSEWVFLTGHDSPYKPHRLEVISA